MGSDDVKSAGNSAGSSVSAANESDPKIEVKAAQSYPVTADSITSFSLTIPTTNSPVRSTRNNPLFERTSREALHQIAQAANARYGALSKLAPASQTINQLLARRESIRHFLNTILGEQSGPKSQPQLTAFTSLGAKREVHYFQAAYQSSDGDTVPLLILVPDRGGPKGPNIVALHQTTSSGKRETAGLEGNKQYHYGLELARLGYTVFIPDIYGFGERPDPTPSDIPFKTTAIYKKHPNWSAMGKMIKDLKSLATIIKQWGDFANQPLGTIGHSLGGHLGLFWAASDSRVETVVANGSYATFASDDNRLRWARPNHQFSYLPVLKKCFSEGKIPLEWHELLSLILPRTILQMSAYAPEDEVWPTSDSLAQVQLALEQYMRAIAKDDTLPETYFYPTIDTNQKRIVDGKHGFPSFARLKAYQFLNRTLAHPGKMTAAQIERTKRLALSGREEIAGDMILVSDNLDFQIVEPELETLPPTGLSLELQQMAPLTMGMGMMTPIR